MEADTKELDEVIVTAYGTSTKGTYTGSAATVNTETLKKRQVSNVSNALAGEMAGVQILNNNGQPGVGASVRIRGVGSINAGMAPLYVVDGVPFDGDLSSLNTNDIENITVLKDAASTSLYGARGANGIVMITTKSGSKGGDANINFTARWGVNSRQVENYKVLTSPVEVYEKEYAALYNAYKEMGYDDADANYYANVGDSYGEMGLCGGANVFGAYADIFTVPDGELLIGADGKINPKATLGYSDGYNYYTPDNWSDETFKSQQRQSYDLTISGGNERGNYYFSAGYLKDGGVIEDSELTRFSSRFKGEFQAKSWLKIGGNVSYNKTKNRYPGEQTTTNSSGNAFFIANYIAPIYPLYVRDADGNILVENGHTIYDYGDGSYSALNRNFMSIANPIGDLKYNHTEYNKDAFSGAASADITPIKGLTLTARYGINVENERYNDLGNAYIGQSASYEGTASQRSNRRYGLDQQYIIDYNFNIAEVNDIDITAGYDGYQYKYNRLAGYGTHLYNPESFYLSNATMDYSITGYQNTYTTKGFFGRVNYGYNSKYLFNASVRRDASSRFSEDNRWGTFYALSAAWLISNEDFLSASWIDLLKFKASFGEQGNDDFETNGEPNYYTYADQYSITGAEGSYADGILTYKGNPDLTWETSITYNVGFDFALFHSKLNGSIEYFGRKSKDMLYNKPVSGSVGYSSVPMNVGSMTNTGIEIDLNGNVLNFGRSFRWDLNANATFIKNKINELHPDLNGEFVDGSRIYTEGESMYRLYLVRYAGVDKETGDALYYAEDEEGNEITTNEYTTARNYRKATGNLLPKVYGGFGTKFEFFGFDLSASFSYQLGGKIFDSGYQSLMHAGDSYSAGYNWHEDIRKAWTPENPNTDVPKLNYNDIYANSNSDRWIISSNYLALNNITFGYTIPSNLTEKLYISNARLFFVADNLALWSKREGLDPRQSFTSATTARYTAIRTISGGISITF